MVCELRDGAIHACVHAVSFSGGWIDIWSTSARDNWDCALRTIPDILGWHNLYCNLQLVCDHLFQCNYSRDWLSTPVWYLWNCSLVTAQSDMNTRIHPPWVGKTIKHSFWAKSDTFVSKFQLKNEIQCEWYWLQKYRLYQNWKKKSAFSSKVL